MSVCPICDELTINKDVLALGCGHVLCSDCWESMHQLGNDKECPFCKKHIYESEIRKLYLYQADKNELSTEEQKQIDTSTLQSRIQFQKRFNKTLLMQIKENKGKSDRLCQEIETCQTALKNSENKRQQLQEKYERVKNDYRVTRKDMLSLKRQVTEVKDFEHARRWIETNCKNINDLIGNCSEEDQSRSRRLAIVLLTVKENYQKELQRSEQYCRDNNKLKFEINGKDDMITSLRKENMALQEKVNELVTLCAKHHDLKREQSSLLPIPDIKNNDTIKRKEKKKKYSEFKIINRL